MIKEPIMPGTSLLFSYAFFPKQQKFLAFGIQQGDIFTFWPCVVSPIWILVVRGKKRAKEKKRPVPGVELDAQEV